MSYSPRILPLLDVMKTLGQKYGVGVSEVALNWVITKGAIPIVGCRSPRHAKSALASLGWRLSVDDVATLEATAVSLQLLLPLFMFHRSYSK
jgi:aryl-alcohol dehydrogenase-like predicted oxidoreductase